MGLQPILRRIWALRGSRPTAPSRRRYQWLYLYGFVRPLDGKTSWLLLPTVRTPVMSLALELFVKEVDPQQNSLIVLLMDQAGYHTAKDLVIPPTLHLEWLPPYTPELQPVERVWPLVREAVANQNYDDLDQMEQTLMQRCRWLSQNPDVVQKVSCFHWICAAAKQY